MNEWKSRETLNDANLCTTYLVRLGLCVWCICDSAPVECSSTGRPPRRSWSGFQRFNDQFAVPDGGESGLGSEWLCPIHVWLPHLLGPLSMELDTGSVTLALGSSAASACTGLSGRVSVHIQGGKDRLQGTRPPPPPF